MVSGNLFGSSPLAGNRIDRCTNPSFGETPSINQIKQNIQAIHSINIPTETSNHQPMKQIYLLLTTLLLVHVQVFGQSVPSYVPTNGLVGWWGFNGNANDESGNGNHGTVNGATLTTDRFGNQNRAYSFDGISNFIESVTSGPGGTGITLSLWYKTNRYITNGNYVSDIFSYGSTSWGSLFGANFNHWSAQTLGPCFGPSFTAEGTLISRGGPVIPDTTIWHHVVIVLPIGASSLYDVLFFLNGLEQQGVCSFANYGAPPINIGAPLTTKNPSQ